MISSLIARRNRAPWWSDADWQAARHMSTQVLLHYSRAKLAADEHLTVLGENKSSPGKEGELRYLILRPGLFIDGPGMGKVSLGKTGSIGTVSRADVAAVAAELLHRCTRSGWFDLLAGEESLSDAVGRIVKDGTNSRDGESLDAMVTDILY
jgi:hypothetical protein